MKAAQGKAQVLKVGQPEGYDKTRERPTRVLVVDDEPIVRKLLTQVLKSAGYEVVGEAVDGKRAVDMFKRLRPDIVTLDVQMPIMDGFVALEQILHSDPKALVVMLTNRTEKDVVTKVIAAGARDYIVKPINRRLILEKLRRIRGVTF